MNPVATWLRPGPVSCPASVSGVGSAAMGGPVNLPGWVLSIPASLALHAVPLLLLIRLFNPSVPDVFVVDLSEQPEVVQVMPPSESARRLSGPPASPRKSAPHAPRAVRPSPPTARDEAPAEPNPPSLPAPVAALTPEPPPQLPEPPPAQPPAAQPIAPTPPPSAAAPMPQVAEAPAARSTSPATTE